MRSERLIVALDVPGVYEAALLAERVIPYCARFKVRLPLLVADGQRGIKVLDLPPLMVDVKSHDIPASVADDVRALLPLAPWSVTVHASGGPTMIASARRAAETAGATRPLILAVTLLSSLTQRDVIDLGFRSYFQHDPERLVRHLARLAIEAGADGLVCSASKVAALRKLFGSAVTLVTPGVRLGHEGDQDHAKTVTPGDAVRAGADFVVIGRPISQAMDPVEAARAIVADLNAAEPGGSADG